MQVPLSATKGPRSTNLRQASRFAILREIYVSRTPSRQELARATGLSFATVATVVTELMAVGMLVEAGREDSAGGRPRARLQVPAERGLLIGVEVAETYVEVDIFDAALSLLTRRREEVSERADPVAIAESISDGISAGLLDHPGRDVLGVGVSLPGPVSEKAGVSVFDPHWQWVDVPMQTMLEEKLHFPVHIDNPLHAITLAELWFGAQRSTDHLVTVYLGTGVGCGIALGGGMVRGSTNTAGEWGHTTLIMGGRQCRCGRRGCVEAYVGAPGLMQAMRERAPDHPSLAAGQLFFVESIKKGFASRERDAVWLVEQFASCLGAGLANIVNLINPEVIVLSGWLFDELGTEALGLTRQQVSRESIAGAGASTTLVQTSLVDPVSLGMATFALERFLADVGLPSQSLGPLTRWVRREGIEPPTR